MIAYLKLYSILHCILVVCKNASWADNEEYIPT